MISVPLVILVWRSRASKASAGGQVLHPSDVNSSTTTALRTGAGLSVWAEKPLGNNSMTRKKECKQGFFITHILSNNKALPKIQLALSTLLATGKADPEHKST
jgi:hypothetical protein